VRRFAELYAELDRTTKTNRKVDAIVRYLREASPADAAWGVFFLSGQRLKRLVRSGDLARWAMDEARIPDWLLDECWGAVGDLAEVAALLLPEPPAEEREAPLPLHRWVEERIAPLRGLDDGMQRQMVRAYWRELPREERFVLHKLLTGELRVGVSKTLVVRALAELGELPTEVVAHRLMGHWEPSPELLARLLAPVDAVPSGRDPGGADADAAPGAAGGDARSRPYPFFLASPIESASGGPDPAEALGAREDWLAEWKLDGIRAQLIRRGGEVFLWSRGDGLLTERFPEVVEAARDALPDGTVLDGELLAFQGGRPLPFARLQRRIGRKDLDPAVLAEAPVAFVAYDLLEDRGQDLRPRPLDERRRRLEARVPVPQETDDSDRRATLRASTVLSAGSWEALRALREESRDRGVEGIMLKRRASPYRAGRRKGDWWKWKVAPHTLDAVLLYAHPGSGKRASLYSDYTFALWDGDALVPFAKAYSGLDDAQVDALDRWVRGHTLERFGPVRAVEPSQVFELAFEGIRTSTRHRSGVAVRFPRVLRWRTDKRPEEADTLATAEQLIRE